MKLVILLSILIIFVSASTSSYHFFSHQEGDLTDEYLSDKDIIASDDFTIDSESGLANIIPRNISESFRGSWTVIRLNETAPHTFPLIQSIENGWSALPPPYLPPGTFTGTTLFTLYSKETALKDVDLVVGEVVFRDGPYSTSTKVKYNLEGFYFARTGTLHILGIPSTPGPYIPHVTGIDWKNATQISEVSERLKKRTASEYPTDATGEPIEANSCLFKFIFQLAYKSTSRLTFDETGRDFFPSSTKFRASAPPRHLTLSMIGGGSSPTCGIELQLSGSLLNEEVYVGKASGYVALVIMTTLIEITSLWKQMEFTSTRTGAARVSLTTIGLQGIMDSLLCLVHLTFSILLEPVSNTFAIASFFKFMSFAMFEMRYLLQIYKARDPQAFSQGLNAIRSALFKLYLRFYAALFVALFLFYRLKGTSHDLYIIFLFSYWIPQVVTNAYRDQAKAIHPIYLLAVTSSRLLIPSYFLMCPYNVASIENNFRLIATIIVWSIGQVLLLWSQDVLGPRFFIPAQFLPEKYNYKRSIPERLLQPSTPTEQSNQPLLSGVAMTAAARRNNNNDEEDDDNDNLECVICMSGVTPGEHMITPCNHVFHSTCLEQWMEIKMECPTCRSELPVP